MQKHITQFLREYFSFSRKEKRGMLVLAGILFCLLLFKLGLPFIEPATSIDYAPGDWTQQVSILQKQQEQVLAKAYERQEAEAGLFPFDPNTIDSASFQRLGFSPRQTSAFMKFRRSGAVFRTNPDLRRVFFIDAKHYARLEPWIRISITSPDKPSPSGSPGRVTQFVSINACDSATLVGLPGIGPYTASKVLRYREWLGGFIVADQFAEIKGLRPEQVDSLVKYCVIETQGLKRLAINTASQEQLEAHPYIRYKAKILLRYRQQHGSFQTPAELLKTGVVDEPLLKKLMPYLTFD